MPKIKKLVLISIVSAGLLLTISTFAQDRPIKIGVSGSFQHQVKDYKASDARGFGIGTYMSFSILRNFDVRLNIQYDYMYLNQADVLDEWDWAYWERTYIDFLPGTNAEIVNKTLTYTSTDSIYSAEFNPNQRLKELRLFTGFDYYLPISRTLSLRFGVDGGFSLFNRELSIREHWTKRFKLDSLSTEKFDYEFTYNLLHFAPAKKGTRIFIAPAIGMKMELSPSFDLELAGQYVYYVNQDKVFGILLAQGQEWLPIKSKILLTMALIFKY